MDNNSAKLSNEANGRIILSNHVLCWAIFIAYELSVLYYSIGSLERPYVYIVYYIINISYFYAYLSLLNFTFKSLKIKYVKGIASFLVLLALYLFVKSVADYILDSQPAAANHSLFFYIDGFLPRNLIRATYFTVLAVFYWSSGRISVFRKKAIEAEKQQLTIQKEKAELATQLARSRNAYLQQQINPHLLFNALNFIYNSAQKYSEDAAQCIWLLSDIMRFSLEEAAPDGKIKLDREAEQMENLLAINRYRYSEPIYITMEMEGEMSRFKIIPLILLTLTENVFKHGRLHEADRPAVLKLKVDETGNLLFYSRNLSKAKNEHKRRRPPIGLENVRIRLDSHYPGLYQLQVTESGEYYELTLTLALCA